MQFKSGVARWATKTVSDPAARTIDWTPQDTTIAALVALPRPPRLSRRSKRQPAEMQVVRVRARLAAAKVELDGDIHCVLADPNGTGATLVGEIPLPDLLPATCAQRKAITETRWRAELHLPNLRSELITLPPMFAVIEGLVFFDTPHGQDGAAPNAIEIHPILKLTFEEAP